MKEITEQQIDNVIDKVFTSVANDIAVQYTENISQYNEVLKEENDVIKESIKYFAAIKTAQDNCILTLKEALKELLCD